MKTPQQAALQKNKRLNLIRTLECFSNRERQEEYKRSVPFVQVPRELLAQWDEYSHLLKERQDWFIQSLTVDEFAAVMAFDSVVAEFACGNRLPDVPEIFDKPQWIELMSGASKLLAVLKSTH